jgi:aspartate racemase
VKHLGILAHSFEGAGLCFRTACLEGVKRLGEHMHPEITMTCSPMALVLDAWERGDNAKLRAFFAAEAGKLAAAGADFFVCPDNTAHIALESEGAIFPIPGMHIGEVVAEEALRRGFRKVGVLGTKYTMAGPVYPGALGRRGIGQAVPDEAGRAAVNRIIFDELCLGVFEPSTTEVFVHAITELGSRGADCVILGCTEIPLIISDSNSSLPVLDSTRLLAKYAVREAVDARPLRSRSGWLQVS